MDQSMCPICLDDIILAEYKNLVITECGHTFHCSCLMTNIVHNDLICPCCRAEMADLNVDDKSEQSEHFVNGFGNEPFDDETFTGGELYDNYALTSFRMFQQQIAGEPVEIDEEYYDYSDEEDDDYSDEEDDNEEEEPTINQIEEIVEPGSTYVSNKLQEANVTFDDLVKYMLHINHNVMGLRYKDYKQHSNKMETQIDDILNQYLPEDGVNIVENIVAESKGNSRRNIETL